MIFFLSLIGPYFVPIPLYVLIRLIWERKKKGKLPIWKWIILIIASVLFVLSSFLTYEGYLAGINYAGWFNIFRMVW